MHALYPATLNVVHFYPGQTVGDYSVIELLGGSGTAVYRVKHGLTDREEAIKVVYGAGQGSIADSQKFLEEIRLQARLKHPHITEVMTAFWADDDLVMVTELPEGRPVRALMAEGKLGPAEAIEIMRQILDALKYAHNQRVIHRGISPDSILYSPTRKIAKLTDFGLARARADQRTQAKSTTSLVRQALLHYSAPEMLRAEAADARADIYGCGATLYELLTGHCPYESASETTLLLAIERENLTPPSKHNPLLSEKVDAIVKKAMKAWPDERYASAEDLLKAIEPLAKSIGTAAKPAKATQNIAGATPKTHLVGLAGGALASAALLLYLIQTSYRPAEAAKPRPAVAAAPQQQPTLVPLPTPAVEQPAAAAIPEVTPAPQSVVAPPVKSATAAPKPIRPIPKTVQAKVAPPAQPVKPAIIATKPIELVKTAPPTNESTAPLVKEQPPQTAVSTPAVPETPVVQPANKPGVVARVGSGLKKLNPFRKAKKDKPADGDTANSLR